MVQAQEEQRARIAQLEAQRRVNDQEKNLNMQIASNGAAIAQAEAEKQTAVRQQREAELSATQITTGCSLNAQQNVEFKKRPKAARRRKQLFGPLLGDATMQSA